jgi:hypothetical protein
MCLYKAIIREVSKQRNTEMVDSVKDVHMRNEEHGDDYSVFYLGTCTYRQHGENSLRIKIIYTYTCLTATTDGQSQGL